MKFAEIQSKTLRTRGLWTQITLGLLLHLLRRYEFLILNPGYSNGFLIISRQKTTSRELKRIDIGAGGHWVPDLSLKQLRTALVERGSKATEVKFLNKANLQAKLKALVPSDKQVQAQLNLTTPTGDSHGPFVKLPTTLLKVVVCEFLEVSAAI